MLMIQNSSISYDTIKSDVLSYVQSLDIWNQIKENVDSSNIDLIVSLISATSTYIIYKNNQLRNETYLSSAKLTSSVYTIARTFGYQIPRYTSPKIRVRYNEVPTRVLTRGEILGSYGDYDLIYFGEDNPIEKLDYVDLSIGKYTSYQASVISEDNIIKYRLEPESLTSVDENQVSFIYRDEEIEISKNVEDYIVNNKIVDYSLDPYSTELMVTDKDYNYGLNTIEEGATVDIGFIETDGEDTSIDINNIELDDEFIPIEIIHTGSSGQSLDQIKQLAPLFYSTQRRMVTKQDYRYVSEAHSWIKSAAVTKDEGQIKLVDLIIDESVTKDDILDFELNGVRYTYQVENTTFPEIAEEIHQVLLNNPICSVTSVENNILHLRSRDAQFPIELDLLTENLTQDITQVGIVPRCCTVNIYYVKYNTVDDPISLTYYEQKEMMNYYKYYKMVGSRIVLIPATANKVPMDLTITLRDPQYKDQVDVETKKLISEYELTLETEFKMIDLLSKISQIDLIDEDGNHINPVISVFPTELLSLDADLRVNHISDYDIESDIKSYIKFTPINLTII